MANITRIITDRSIPNFIKDDYPIFVAWLGAYYDYLQLQGNPLDLVQNLLQYTDIDSTLDEFISHFHAKYMSLIPTNIIANPRLVAKHIKDFYLNKGNEASFRFLFRILYNEEIEFYYPSTDILRCSDGKWQQIVSIKIAQDGMSNIHFLFNAILTGSVSNAKTYVNSVLTYTERGEAIYELILNGLRGSFVDGEEILVNGVSHSPQIFVLEVVTGIQVVNGGYRYNVGDSINIVDTLTSNVVGNGQVVTTARGPIVGFSIVEGGIGYRGEFREVTDFAFLPIGYTLNGVYLPGAIIGGPPENFAAETISHPITTQIIPDVGDIIQVTDAPEPIGQNAAGIVSLVDQVGQILQATVTDFGENYDLPVCQVISATGKNADLNVLGGGGRITNVSLNNFPIVERTVAAVPPSTIMTDTLVPDFTLSPTGIGATGNVVDDGGTIVYPGDWLTDDGKLSSRKKLQDNLFYQDFSYAILSRIQHETWKNIVKKVIHPAGFLEFGKLKFNSLAVLPSPQVVESVQTITPTTGGRILLPEGGSLQLTEGGYLLTL
jgi:hypothetical protein